MDWTKGLVSGINKAINIDGNTRIAVHSQSQQKHGLETLSRMAPGTQTIDFEIIPEDRKHLYPVGAILPKTII